MAIKRFIRDRPLVFAVICAIFGWIIISSILAINSKLKDDCAEKFVEVEIGSSGFPLPLKEHISICRRYSGGIIISFHNSSGLRTSRCGYRKLEDLFPSVYIDENNPEPRVEIEGRLYYFSKITQIDQAKIKIQYEDCSFGEIFKEKSN